MDVFELCERISTRQDFENFVQALLADWMANSRNWENPTLDGYLEAMAAVVEAMPYWYGNEAEVPPEQPTWNTLGRILLAASRYE